MAKSDLRPVIKLVCTEDKRSVYWTQKNKRNTTTKLELRKYNPYLRKHTIHKEAK